MSDLLDRLGRFTVQSDLEAWTWPGLLGTLEDNTPPFPQPRASLPLTKQQERTRLWASVISQQLQADRLAIQMAHQIYTAVQEPEAQNYYSRMVAEESIHTSAWTDLVWQAGGPTQEDPYLNELVRIVLEADTLEEKVFLMQVFFEAAIIPRFTMIAARCAKTSPGRLLENGKRLPGTALEALCRQLKQDDGRHHGSGVVYLNYLLQQAGDKVRSKVVHTAVDFALPVFTQHAFWRPSERSISRSSLWEVDALWVTDEVARGVKIGTRLGLPFGNVGVELPRP